MTSGERSQDSQDVGSALGPAGDSRPLESALAALVVKGDDGAKPDYALAFRPASDSAQAGDITGQILPVSLYRNGQGTPQDNQNAEYWVKRAEQTKSGTLWNQLNTKNVGAL